MGRPREFDQQKALDAALDLFWEKGYEATSLADLTAAMKLQKASLYNAFGDKKSLFLAALERYQTESIGEIEEELAKGFVLTALRRWLKNVVDFLTSKEGAKGCLCFNAATEMVPHDAEVAAQVQHHIKAMQKVVVQALLRGQASGEINQSLDTQATAWHLINGLAGLQVIAKCKPTRKTLTGIAAALLVPVTSNSSTSAEFSDGNLYR
jgi:TetR/AcrR family transcriptional regulator, transcriptional repressor for nem operon